MKKNENDLQLKTILVSCENKVGLVDNKGCPELPNKGILGYFCELYPQITFLSSGGTLRLIDDAGLNVLEMEDYTHSPQMKDGLLKSIDYKIHGSIMAQDFNVEDIKFLEENNLQKIDAVITNYQKMDFKRVDVIKSFAQLEEYRNRIDIGGPLMCMTARKGFLNTLLLTDPGDYGKVIRRLQENNGRCSLSLRIEMLKKSSLLLKEYSDNIISFYEKISSDLS
ncbi:hypothetical protein [Lactococcus lactis]|uniref:hypothetical protein n=1 Tax=Lactococcus lactis TaxID=1358 RepID=UPI0018C8556B|nr:hypothetical protein [Lactococcus lactis]MBG1279091.1 hypothetical protein [Lactococcus lactis subsp. lactis]